MHLQDGGFPIFVEGCVHCQTFGVYKKMFGSSEGGRYRALRAAIPIIPSTVLVSPTWHSLSTASGHRTPLLYGHRARGHLRRMALGRARDGTCLQSCAVAWRACFLMCAVPCQRWARALALPPRNVTRVVLPAAGTLVPRGLWLWAVCFALRRTSGRGPIVYLASGIHGVQAFAHCGLHAPCRLGPYRGVIRHHCTCTLMVVSHGSMSMPPGPSPGPAKNREFHI